MSRLILVPLALILLLVLAAAVLIPRLLDKDKVLQLAAEALQEHTGATLRVDGDARLSLFPTLGIALSDATITLPEKQQTDLRDLRVGTLQIGVQFFPLLRGHVEIDTIVLDGVRARLESGSKQAGAGTAALSDADLDALYAIRRKRMATAAEVGAAQVAVIAPLALRVKQLTITDARLELPDAGGTAPKVIELLRLEARDLNLDDAAVPVDMTLRLPGKQVIDVRLKGDIRIDQQHQLVTLEQVELTVSGALANVLQLRTSGVVDLSRQSADLQLALELGETRGTGTVRYASFESPQIDSVLQLNLLDPALLALAGPDALAATGQKPAAASGDQPLPLDTLRAIDARTVLNVEKARFGAHTVNNMHASLLALDGVIQVTALAGELHGGRLEASGTLDGKHNTVTLDTSGSLSRLDLANTLAAMKSKPTLTGSATVDWQLHSQGPSVQELKSALHGPIKLTTEEVVLKGVSVEKLLCNAVALSNKEQLTASFPADTRFTSLAADIQLAAGKATFNPLHASLPQVALSGDGNYALLQKNFEATFQARLAPELEQLDHACRVSKRLTAIDLPVHCAGSVTAEPSTWCRVDAAQILQALTVNEGPEKLEKIKKKASKFLDKLFNKGN
jgi:AsmA protein